MASVDPALSFVSAILRIGEIEHGRRRAEFRVLDLSGMALDAFELYEPLADEDGVVLRLDAPAGALVYGGRDLLLEAAGNLLDNALKFAPRESDVTLSVWKTSDSALLSVTDRGPGIPASER